MSLTGKIFSGVVYCCYHARSKWYLGRFLLLQKQLRKRLELGDRVFFNVPVRSVGRGALIIGSRSIFGVRAAHRLGTGEILLETRHRNAEITIGKANWLSNNISIIANQRIVIGNGCQIGDMVAIYDCDFHEIDPERRNSTVGPTSPVTIGNNVWLGSRVMVLKGVTIGDNSVIGAMSLVTKSIPANSVAAGNPAKVIRSIE